MNTIELRTLIETSKKVTDLRIVIKNYMEDCPTAYPSGWTLFQKTYHELYLKGSTDTILCPVCHIVPLKFSGLRKGYARNCSASCRNRNPDFLKKYKDACLEKYGTEFASQSAKFRNTVRTTNMTKYGVDNPFKSVEIRKKHKQTCMEKYGVDNPSKSADTIAKIRKSRINSGDWVSDEKRTDLEKYRMQVKQITARSYHEHYYKINPDNLPRARYKYHLDHIFSVEEGFKQGVSAEIIGHWSNLQMLWHLDNSVKNTKCHKTLIQLIEDYNKSKPR